MDEFKRLYFNDDVNKFQLLNDIFFIVMYIFVYKILVENIILGIEVLRDMLQVKFEVLKDVVKIGCMYFMDVILLILGQEFFGYVFQLDYGI